MHVLDEELWILGIPAKTKHNEVAPAQHELAPVFETANVAVDHNQLSMEIMKKVAEKHGLVCLLHEKPFDGINGSGKHNNWSMVTNTGVNLLDPGKNPAENTQFLIFLMAVVKAVDEYADLMRLSVATAGNDHRLGANEAPPAIVSMYLGDELTAILESIESDTFFGTQKRAQMETGATVLPHFFKDTTDRNRTSPFAFTGNKFEFRMLGSSLSVSGPNIILNTAVAEILSQFYEELKNTKPEDMEAAIYELVKRTFIEHKKIIFNGNGYTDEWVKEAKRRGLPNMKSTPDVLPCFIAEKNVKLFTKHHVFTEGEIHSRYEILLEEYGKTLHIEAKTMKDMICRDFLPALSEYTTKLALSIQAKKQLTDMPCTGESNLLATLSKAYDDLYALEEKLESSILVAESMNDILETAKYYCNTVIPDMNSIRLIADTVEEYLPDDVLPYPNYEQLLFSI